MKAYLVSREGLKNNIDIVKSKAGGRAIYAVLKGNGYGLGLLQLARELRDSGIERFAVTDPKDALKLRLAGFTDEEILVMSSTSDEGEITDILDARAVATIGSYEAAVMLNGLAEKRGEIVEAHIKLDTGMGRYGFEPGQLDKIISIYRFLTRIAVTGLYTHSNIAFLRSHKAEEQRDKLLRVADELRRAGYDPGCVHIANSPYLFQHDMEGTNAVRIGSAFTGRVNARGAGSLKPIGRGVATVTEIRWLGVGSTVGYGNVYTTKEPTRAAVIPFGYADGFMVTRGSDIFRFRDKLRYMWGDFKLFFRKKRVYVTINDKKVPVLGHVGMVHTVVDVTKIKCEVGDRAYFELSPIYASPLLERIYE